MRLAPHSFLSLAIGGMLLASPSTNRLHADSRSAAANGAGKEPSAKLSAAQAPSRPEAAKSPAGSTASTAAAAAKSAAEAGRLGTSAALPQPTQEELQFVALVNKERARNGLSQLAVDPLLILVARQHSAEMRDRGYFNHKSPTPGTTTPMDRYLKACSARPAYACVGENLFWATVVDVQRGHTAFMESPTHRENVLFPRFEKIGVGIIKNERGEFWVTQMFLTNTDPNTTVAKKTANK